MKQGSNNSGAGVSPDSPDKEARAFRERMTELKTGKGMSDHDAAHKIRAEENERLVKMNAQAQAQKREPAQETARRAEPARPTRPVAQRSAGMASDDASMASVQTRLARELAARQRQAAQQNQQQKPPAAQTAARAEPAPQNNKEMTDRAQRQQSRAGRYQELKAMHQGVDASRGNSGQGKGR